jgi:ABC-2 type transport system ATP-binding protein
MEVPNAVETQDLAKHFGRTKALTGITLSIRSGEVFGLLGPSGCGKTTFLRLLSTLEAASQGSGQVAGFDLRTQPGGIRAHTGACFLRPCLDPAISVYENLELFATLASVPKSQRTGRIIELLHLLELFPRRDSPVRLLSEGRRRQVDLARALLHDPEVLLWDEPLAGFDCSLRKRVWDHFQDRRAAGPFTVVLASASGSALEPCHRVAIMDRGRIVVTNSPMALRGTSTPDTISIRPVDDALARRRVRDRLRVAVEMEDGSFRLEVHQGDQYVSEFLKEFAPHVCAIAVRRPSLDDVMARLTGRGAKEPHVQEPKDGGIVTSYDLTPPSEQDQ